MEYAKDEVFSIRYNEKRDRLEYSFFKKLYKRLIKNKFLSLLITLGILFSIIDLTLIYCFFEVLNTI